MLDFIFDWLLKNFLHKEKLLKYKNILENHLNFKILLENNFLDIFLKPLDLITEISIMEYITKKFPLEVSIKLNLLIQQFLTLDKDQSNI